MKTRSLKSLTTSVLAFMAFFPMPTMAIDIYVDPTLTATVITATSNIKGEHEKQNEKLSTIQTMNLAIAEQLHRIHQIEDSVFSYLSNAQQFVNNLYDVKKCIQLAAINIPSATVDVMNAIPGHLKGTIIATAVGKNVRTALEEMTSLYGFLEILCKTGGYVDGYGSDQKLEKVNLLNSSQRYYVLSTIRNKLESIAWQMKVMKTQITIYGWQTLFMRLDPTTWAYYVSGRNIANDIIRRMGSFNFDLG